MIDCEVQDNYGNKQLHKNHISLNHNQIRQNGLEICSEAKISINVLPEQDFYPKLLLSSVYLCGIRSMSCVF